MTHVVDGADGESVLGEVDGGELDEPGGLAGVAVDDADDGLNWGKREPGLGEEFEVLVGRGEGGGGVGDGVVVVEFGWG